MFKKHLDILWAASFVVFLWASFNHIINQRAFKNIFGFYLTSNFHSLHASIFNCVDCDSRYITFKPSAETFNKILSEQECTFERFDYRKHGDYLGSIMQDPPAFWEACIDGGVCTYKEGGLWYNSDTGLMCYAHILI